MIATAAGRPDLRDTVLRLREAMRARPRSPESPAAAAVVTPVPAPAGPAEPGVVAEPETVEAIAAEVETLLREALAHPGVQRDSVRLVLACHAAAARLAPAQVREIRALIAGAREPMTAEEREAWKADFMAFVREGLARLEAVHRQGAQDYGLALRDETRRLVRAADTAAVWRAAWAMGLAWVAGAVVGGAVVAALLR
ncbi:hypothetical protein [Paracraurococcus lichenis]|uniref:Conjugal transfer protein TraM n=1 Tax=Paracraurococcus lichenis TaxID=3064888 RepID=A0ABT9E8S3_9PROT|nr:hypothetical protein [Paracraurococcus sp. LOR1-02]MDO9712561.1 hypothetical protein [Paracraurococcus sp. LOR1-02]